LKDEGLAAINYFMYSGVNNKINGFNEKTPFHLGLQLFPTGATKRKLRQPLSLLLLHLLLLLLLLLQPRQRSPVSLKTMITELNFQFSDFICIGYFFYVTLYPWQKRDACLETSL